MEENKSNCINFNYLYRSSYFKIAMVLSGFITAVGLKNSEIDKKSSKRLKTYVCTGYNIDIRLIDLYFFSRPKEKVRNFIIIRERSLRTVVKDTFMCSL